MKIEKISLKDFKGGLNDRDPASALAQDECARLENYFTDGKGLLEKRPGMDIIQFAPINPQPFTEDGDTTALYHLDEAAQPYAEAGGGIALQWMTFSPEAPRTGIQSAGIFTAGQQFYASRPIPLTTLLNGTGLSASNTVAFAKQIEGKSACTFDGWVNPTNTFGGQPFPTQAGPSPVYFSNSPNGVGVPIVATANFDQNDFYAYSIANGLTIHRDWDFVNHKPSTNIYVSFRIQTKIGSGFQVTVVSGGNIPAGKWTHIRGTYNSLTGYVNLYANGALIAQATTTGLIHDPGPSASPLDAYGYFVGALQALAIDPLTGSVSTTKLPHVFSAFDGQIDEVRISSVDRGAAGFPFDYPRGMGFEFTKSDGTRQAVVSAADKLWYTLGDGNWTQMKFYDGTVPSFSTVAYWDAIFRKDILYLSNGVDRPLAWDGSTLVNWMGPVTPPTLSLSATIGTITAGAHTVAYSYLYGTSETALSPTATLSNAGGEQINVADIPPRHSNCTGVRIYMSKNGSTTLYLAREIAHTPGAAMSISGPYTPGSGAAYNTDTGALGPADGSLGGTGYPQVASQVATALSPNPRFLLAEHDRAFVCGMEDDRYILRFSELGAFDVFGVFSFAQAASNQGNLIGLASYYGEVHCSKDGRATLILRGSNPQNWRVLETLHPNVGAIDHWSYVHRYPVESDHYVLCFKGREGFYKYAGQQIECISDKIKRSTERLSSDNSTRDEWSVTTEAQWEAQVPSGGSATLNMQANKYESDGLRQNGGSAEIWNQLEPLGLWPSASLLVAGNIISVEKGVNEGEFYFATDAATTLYWTPDNFQTVQTIATTLAASERIIAIKRRATDDFYFLITDTASGTFSGGGNIYSVDDPTGSGGIGPVFITLTTSPLFYDLDVAIRMQGGVGSANNGRTLGHVAVQPVSSPNNLFSNHLQTPILCQATVTTQAGTTFFNFEQTTNGNISGPVTSSVLNAPFLVTTAGTANYNLPAVLQANTFYSFNTYQTVGPFMNNTALQVVYTRREFPRWLGGTFSPQPYWDAANSRLVFLASTAQDANGNRSTYLRTLTLAGVLTNQYTAENVSSFTTDGTSIWFWSLNQFVAGFTTGFAGRLQQSTLAAPGTVVSSGNYQNNVLALRLSYNAQSATPIIGAYKSLNSGVQEFWTYQSSLQKITMATLLPSSLQALTANGDSGSVFLEIALQTVTPYRWYAAVSRISTADPASMYVVQPNAALTTSVYQSSAYEGVDAANAVTGILSNLLFVAASGASGNNLWADRLYWFASAAASTDTRMLQLGVPGDWTVIGVFESEAHNLGTFSAFDDLQSGFDNGQNQTILLYEVRNAASAAALLAATYAPQSPNSKILGFSPVQPYFQWRITLTWTYDSTSGAIVTSTPSVHFVTTGFFLGNANLPRVIGFHHEGRTFWACAEDNSPNNNVILVWQKNEGWMKIYGWGVQSIFRFRSQMVALKDYQFVRLMTGNTDAGALIVGKARTGAIMGYLDKLLVRLQANIMAIANVFSSRDGYVKITPYQGLNAIDDGAWVMAVPNAILREPRRVLGQPVGEFTYNWIRALSLEIGTSEDQAGDWIPLVDQIENIQQLDLSLELTGDAYDLVVD